MTGNIDLAALNVLSRVNLFETAISGDVKMLRQLDAMSAGNSIPDINLRFHFQAPEWAYERVS